MTSKAEKRKVIPFHENQNCIQPSSSCFPMWKYLVMVIRMLSLDLRLKGKRAGERQAQEFTFAEMPWLNNKAYIYRTTLKTSESHLLSLVTDLSNDFLTLKAAHKNQKQMKKKKWKIPHDCCFHVKKKKIFLLLLKFIFLFISQLGLWLKHIYKKRTKPGPITQRTSCLPLEAYKNKIGSQIGIQGDFHTALSLHVSLLIFNSSLLFSKFAENGGCWTKILRLSLQSSVIQTQVSNFKVKDDMEFYF